MYAITNKSAYGKYNLGICEYLLSHWYDAHDLKCLSGNSPCLLYPTVPSKWISHWKTLLRGWMAAGWVDCFVGQHPKLSPASIFKWQSRVLLCEKGSKLQVDRWSCSFHYMPMIRLWVLWFPPPSFLFVLFLFVLQARK